jgi:endonuclease/exonuclease/phosphatase family metal-dependent hydrolase
MKIALSFILCALALSCHAQSLRLATWNLEWLIAPAHYELMLNHCDKNGQPDSRQRAIPCAPDRPMPPKRQHADLDALARIAASLAVDVVALQEVDGPIAGALVFRQGWQLACFTSRRHPQKQGFAIAAGIAYRCNPELRALDTDGKSRAGADITLWPNTPRALRLLNVHLKSGCFAGPLFKKGVCHRLREQVPIVEDWIDARVKAGERFAVVGDFNRRLEKDAQYPAGADESRPTSMFAAWHDDEPRGALLWRATSRLADSPCEANSRYTQGAIDNILLDPVLLANARQVLVSRVTYSAQDAKRYRLSDHCPLRVEISYPAL